jgi:nitrate/nitrite transport system substrate-binding protein
MTTFHRALVALGLALTATADANAAPPEKSDLKLGFIKLTDCAPLVVAKELGFFEDEDLYVSLEAQANWKILLDRVIAGELDGAHMLAGQPLGATIGIGTKAHVVTAFSMDLNGNAITVSNAIWERMAQLDPALAQPRPPRPISAAALKPVVEEWKARGKPLQMGMVFPLSTHNYELRYWLAAAGIKPGFYTPSDNTGTDGADVLISVTPPPQMPATLEQGTIQGYSVGEPWNQQAVAKGIGVPVVTDSEIWKNNPEKVFGVTAAWADANPETHVRLVKALIRAGRWLDASLDNRRTAVAMLARPEYVGADAAVIANSMTGTFKYGPDDTRELPDFNVFFRHDATYPFYGDGVWFLTQMRRWGQIAEPKTDAWYDETVRSVYKPDVWREAAQRLVAENQLAASDVPSTDGYAPPDAGFIDGVVYDGKRPNAYLQSLAIRVAD